MPKREKTPPPPEDEPRYLVVVHPYPLNAHLQLHGDRRTLALWLACCIGKDVLYAMYHKPTSPGMVIIEVDRYFEHFDSLLGMHTWTSFLKNPTKDDEGKSSKVFWCTYNSGRLVQKNGWRRIDVEEHWFQGWSPSNNIIKHPYPKTTYCDVPAESRTGAPLCRPLPKDTFPPPTPKPRPIVGSAEYVNSRSSDVSFDPPSSPTRRRRGNYGSEITPSDSVSQVQVIPQTAQTAVSGTGARALQTQQRDQPLLSQWLAQQRESQPVWGRPPSVLSSSFTLNSSTSSGSVRSRGAAPPLARSARPLSSLSAQSAAQFRHYEHSDRSSDVGRGYEAEQDLVQMSPTTSVSTKRGPGRSTASPRGAPEAPGAIDPDREYEYEEEDVPRRSTADAMRAIAPGATAVGNKAGLHDVEEEEDDYISWHYPQITRNNSIPAGSEEEDNVTKPWVDYDAPRWEEPTKVPINHGERWLCPDHGSTCSPGICKERARVEAERRRQKEHEERQEAKRQRKEKWKKKREKEERKQALAEGLEVSHDLPPHFYRGAGGSVRSSDFSSDSEDDSPQRSGSPVGSDGPSRSPPAPPSPLNGAAGAEGQVDQESQWGEDDDIAPRVSLPSSSGWSGTGSNRVEGEDEARGVGGPRAISNGNINVTRGPVAGTQESAQAARSAASSAVRTSQTFPSEPPGLVRPADARGSVGVDPAAASPRGNGEPLATRSPIPERRQPTWNPRGAPHSRTATTPVRGDESTGSQWPAPGQSHPASNTRGTTSAWMTTTTTTTTTTEPDADAAQVTKSRRQNGRQDSEYSESAGGTSASTFSDHQSTGGPGGTTTSRSSSVSSFVPRSPASMSRIPSSSPGVFYPVDGGFPSFNDTTWGDPIAAAQASMGKSKYSYSPSRTRSTTSSSAIGDDTTDGQAEAGQEQEQDTASQNAGTGRGRRGRRGGRRNMGRRTAPAPAAAANAGLDTVRQDALDVTLPPGGPGKHWADEKVEW